MPNKFVLAFKKYTTLNEKIATPSKPKLLHRRRNIKIYKLGKNTKDAKISVLIKCSKTRKMVQNEQKILRTKCLTEIKQYLRKHNLIKIGSSAPEDILRKIYEDSFLAGNIYNKNPQNLLHNFLGRTNSLKTELVDQALRYLFHIRPVEGVLALFASRETDDLPIYLA